MYSWWWHAFWCVWWYVFEIFQDSFVRLIFIVVICFFLQFVVVVGVCSVVIRVEVCVVVCILIWFFRFVYMDYIHECACVWWNSIYMFESRQMVCAMGWLRSVGSIKLQVSFAEYRLFYEALLQKGPIILSILLNKANPYIVHHLWTRYSSVIQIAVSNLNLMGLFSTERGKRDVEH